MLVIGIYDFPLDGKSLKVCLRMVAFSDAKFPKYASTITQQNLTMRRYSYPVISENAQVRSPLSINLSHPFLDNS